MTDTQKTYQEKPKKNETAPNLIFVIGGARSGKSKFAEQYMLEHSPITERPYLYFATSRILDDEMKQRVTHHRNRRRPNDWKTIEAPIELPQKLSTTIARPALIDCLTLWLSNLLIENYDRRAMFTSLTQSLIHRRAMTIVISNEVGCGIVPDNKIARQFRDEAGLLNQHVAKIASKVFLVTAGLPLRLK